MLHNLGLGAIALGSFLGYAGQSGGYFSDRFIRPVIGFGFDLTGSIYRVDRCRFEIPVHLTDRKYRSAFVFGEYEAGERRLIRQFLRADDRVIELGGCIGVLSCLVNSQVDLAN